MDPTVISEIYIYGKYPNNPYPFSWVSVKKWGDDLGICPRGMERGAARGQRQLGSN